MINLNLNDSNNPLSKVILVVIIIGFAIVTALGSNEQSIKCVPNAGCVVTTKANRFADTKTVTFDQSEISRIEISSYKHRRHRSRHRSSRTRTYYYPVIVLNDNTRIPLYSFKSGNESYAKNLADDIKQNRKVDIHNK